MSTNLIGEIAEGIAVHYLQEKGYVLCKFGNDVRRSAAGYETNFNLPVMQQNGLKIPIGAERHELCGKSALEVLDDFSKGVRVLNDFATANFLVNEFIQRYHWMHSENNKSIGQPPHHGTKYIKDLTSKNKEKRAFAEQCKRENLEWYASNRLEFPSSGSHPGKYDLIGFYEGEYTAIEIKANTSKLSYWQKVRFSLLNRFGFKIKLLIVELDVNNHLIEIKEDDCANLVSPLEISDELFSKVVNFRSLHEKSSNNLGVFTKKYSSICY